MFSAGVVLQDARRCRRFDGEALHAAAPELQYVLRVGESSAAEAAAPDRHLALAERRVGQRFFVVRAERLKAQPPGVIAAGPRSVRNLGVFQAFALDDRQLPPGAVDPDVPGDMPRRT